MIQIHNFLHIIFQSAAIFCPKFEPFCKKICTIFPHVRPVNIVRMQVLFKGALYEEIRYLYQREIQQMAKMFVQSFFFLK